MVGKALGVYHRLPHVRRTWATRPDDRNVTPNESPLAHDGEFQIQGFAAERAFLVIRCACEPTDACSAHHLMCRFNIGNY